MTDFLLSTRPQHIASLPAECLSDFDPSVAPSHGMFLPGRVLPLGEITTPGSQIRAILDSTPPANMRRLAELSMSLDSEQLLALAEIREKLGEYSLSGTGAATAVYAGRMGAFGEAVQKYQKALLHYRSLVQAKAPSSMRREAERAVRSASERMQAGFRNELSAVTSRIRARRGVPLNDAQRGLNIAKSSRSASKLQVMSQIEAHSLVRFSRYATHLGNGLAVIDFGSRAGRIHTSYVGGGNWEREMFIETSSFALSTIAGTITAKAGLLAMGLVVAATPIGWVGLIATGVGIAGAAAGASISVNNLVKEDAGTIYDELMKKLNSLWS
ncbi:hypothetical protein [Marinobacter sp.]|uniref:hypothetical protein n=1 Tax=Marinobacter sp. TaxID=50741 RepID=UPI00384B10F1